MKRHLRAFLASLTITLFAGPALAEDLMPPSTEPSFDWTGFYVGVNGGYNWGQLDTSDNSVTTTGPLVGLGEGTFVPTTFPGEDSSTSVDGWLGGAQIGYNHQMGSWVLGIEADFQSLDFKDSDSFLGSIAGPYYETAAEINAFGTVRGRVGYAFDNVLFFVTGGLAGAQSEAHLAIQGGLPPDAFTGPRFSDSQTESMLGYVVGGGLEWAIADSPWSVKAEYLHVDFGSERYAFNFAGTGGDTAASDGDVTLDIARVGVNFAF